MTEQINAGRIRTDGFSKLYHELFDCYQPYIGDKATLYYTFLLRYRNNDASSDEKGKSWTGRKRAIEQLSFNYTQLRRVDSILEAFDLVRIEYRPSGRGRPLTVYFVNDPIESERFKEREPDYFKRLQRVCEEDEGVSNMLGKKYKNYFSTAR